MWSSHGGTGFPIPGNPNVPNQGYSSTPMNRFEPRMNYSPHQPCPGGVQSPNNYFRGPPPNPPRIQSPHNLYQPRVYHSPNTYFSPRSMSPLTTAYHSGESMLQQPPPCFTTPPCFSDMPPGGHSSSFQSDSYYSCQETFNSSFVSDGSGAMGSPGDGYSGSFSNSPRNYSRGASPRVTRPSTPYRGGGGGGGRFGGNWTSRSLSDPWAGLQPIRTPNSGRCLVATPMGQRHTVLFANRQRVTPSVSAYPTSKTGNEETTGQVDDDDQLLMPARKRFSSARCSPTDKAPSPSSIMMPSFD